MVKYNESICFYVFVYVLLLTQLLSNNNIASLLINELECKLRSISSSLSLNISYLDEYFTFSFESD